ncbi:Gfo/Idh/MocA family oxidoreductase [Micromonospora sp. SL4-19]|uniref:Gfo/Idh/MocA family protein n=1 Tax=Micromonospora sp. SL4-19 TaxID=3399129 RepID=UPI003A4D8D2A
MRIGLAGVGRIGAFHARTLAGLDFVDDLVIMDANIEATRAVADEVRASAAPDVETLLASGIDGFVIAAATPGHASLLRLGIAAGVPTFCEKPVAATLEETIDLAHFVAASEVPVHVGFQRRFDSGYQRARQAVQDGELGFIHTIRANTHDQSPPHESYIPTSGGIFRDCNVHDFDILRFVTGREVATVYATGGNKGADFFSAAGDVDTGGALLTMDDDTVVLVSSTRYNGGGHDVRMEVFGEKGTIAVGLDHSLAMDSAEAEVDFPRGPRNWSFLERFLPAYQAELTAFAEVARGVRASPCTVQDALEAFRVAEACELSRAERRPVALAEIKGN